MVKTLNLDSKISLADEQSKKQELLIWQVSSSKSNKNVYLLGSYHIGKNCQLESPAFNYSFNNAETIVFEIDYDLEANLNSKIQQLLINLIRQKGIPTSNEESLKGFLEPETYQLLEQKAKERDISLKTFAKLKPWVFLFRFFSSEISNSEDKAECGIDSMIREKAQSENKNIAGLETVEYQLEKYLERYITMDRASTIDALSSIAYNENKNFTEDFSNGFSKLVDYINSGNADELEANITSFCKKELKFCESLLFERNRNWLPKIENFLIQKEDSLVVVGAGHLVGSQGLIELLKQKGYQVERLNNNQFNYSK
jgi:uncharacterized protein